MKNGKECILDHDLAALTPRQKCSEDIHFSPRTNTLVVRRDKVRFRFVEEEDGRMFGSVQWLDHSYAEAPVDTRLCKGRYDVM